MPDVLGARTPVTYYMAAPVAAPAAEALTALTVTRGGAVAGATTSPAVVPVGKTFRAQHLVASYVAIATSGYGIVRMRANLAGVVAATSPLLAQLAVGAGTPAAANSTGSESLPLPEGLELPAGAGLGLTLQGMNALTGTLVGYLFAALHGFEY